MEHISSLVRVVAWIICGGAVIVIGIFSVIAYMYKRNQFKGE